MNRLYAKWGLFAIGLIIGGVMAVLLMRLYDDQQAKALFYVASQHYDQKDYSLAAALLNQSLGKNPENYAPYHLLGNIYYEQGDKTLALEMYQAALARIGDTEQSRFDRQQIQGKISELTK